MLVGHSWHGSDFSTTQSKIQSHHQHLHTYPERERKRIVEFNEWNSMWNKILKNLNFTSMILNFRGWIFLGLYCLENLITNFYQKHNSLKKKGKRWRGKNCIKCLNGIISLILNQKQPYRNYKFLGFQEFLISTKCSRSIGSFRNYLKLISKI